MNLVLPSGWNASVLIGPKWPLIRPNSSSIKRWKNRASNFPSFVEVVVTSRASWPPPITTCCALGLKICLMTRKLISYQIIKNFIFLNIFMTVANWCKPQWCWIYWSIRFVSFQMFQIHSVEKFCSRILRRSDNHCMISRKLNYVLQKTCL